MFIAIEFFFKKKKAYTSQCKTHGAIWFLLKGCIKLLETKSLIDATRTTLLLPLGLSLK